jgi:hypothetical protein
MNDLIVNTPKSRKSPKLLVAIALGLAVTLGSFAAGSSARADDWHHRDHGGYHGGWGGGVYVAPPVVYANPGYGYYAPPPVVYGPSVGISLPGVSVGIN